MKCWSTEQWARITVEGPDDDFLDHVETCTECARAWAAEAALDEVLAELPTPEPSERADEVRAAVLAQSQPAPPPRPPRWPLWAVGAVAAAALVAIWVWPAPAPSRPTVATVTPNTGAEFSRVSALPDERYAVESGAVHFAVQPLTAGERFRVLTDDAEVEVLGTAFTVDVVDGRLRGVVVEHGSVRVSRPGQATLTLEAGEKWRARVARPGKKTARAADAATPPVPDAGAPDAAADALVDAPRAPPKVGRAAKRPARPRAAEPDSQPDAAVAKPTPQPDAAVAKRAEASPAELAFDRGWRALKAGRHAAAAEQFTLARASGTGPLAADAAFWRAVALGRAGRSAAARTAFEAFLRSHGGHRRAGHAAVSLGWIHFEAGRVGAAERAFRRGLDDPRAATRKSAQTGLDRVKKRR